jgi:hypothetical protein
VVITIIVILMSLTAAAIIKFREVGPRSATRTNNGKIVGSLGTQWKAVNDRAEKEALTPTLLDGTSNTFYTQAMVGATSTADPAVRLRYKGLKLLQAFPTSFSEALQPNYPNTVTPWPGYVNYLSALGITTANAATAAAPEVQSAVCLLMIIKVGPSSNLNPDDLGPAVGLLPLAGLGVTTTGIKDGWGNAVIFDRGAPGGGPRLTSAGSDGQFGTWDDIVTINP